MVGGINDIVFHEPFYRHTDGSYLPGDNPSARIAASETLVPRVRALVRWAKSVVERGQPGQNATFEDVFFLLRQIYDHVRGEYENPALAPMVRQAEDFNLVLNAITPSRWEQGRLHEVTGEACKFIADAVAWALLEPQVNLNAHGALVHAIKEARSSGHKAVVATLNHDVVLERVFNTDFRVARER
jgi:hypothetical protein